VFAATINTFTADQWLDEGEAARLRVLRDCLATLGWAPSD